MRVPELTQLLRAYTALCASLSRCCWKEPFTGICAHFPFTRPELFEIVKFKALVHIPWLMHSPSSQAPELDGASWTAILPALPACAGSHFISRDRLPWHLLQELKSFEDIIAEAGSKVPNEYLIVCFARPPALHGSCSKLQDL